MQPVVRPLPVLASRTEAIEFVLAQPIKEDGYHHAFFLLNTYRVDAGDESIVPLVEILIEGNAIGMYIYVCDSNPIEHFVDGTGVTTQVLCDNLPCAVGTTDSDAAVAYLGDFVNDLAQAPYYVDEVAWGYRDYPPGSYVDAIIDF